MIAFILNLPYTIAGFLAAFFSVPANIKITKKPFAFLISVKSFWWAFGYMKNARAMTIGNTVLLGSKLKDRDLEHELVHVEQYERFPLIFPILYYIELMRRGYRKNKYEEEAYSRAKNVYKEKLRY